jgi:predicted Fe-Mo cluster-binding NifX family protein
MKIAIATDQDFVSSHFGCCPAFTIVNIEDGRIRDTFIIPNPGCQHEYWADLFFRNSIKHLIVGNMGSKAQSVLKWRGIDIILGVEGRIDDVVRRFAQGELRGDAKSGQGDCDSLSAAACRHSPRV